MLIQAQKLDCMHVKAKTVETCAVIFKYDD